MSSWWEPEEEDEYEEPEPLEFTYHTNLALGPKEALILKDLACLASQVEHSIWAGFQAKKPLDKNESLKNFGILGRNYNSYLARVKADFSSSKERQKLDLESLENKLVKQEMIRDQAHGSARVYALKTTLERLIQVKISPFKPLSKKELASLEKKIIKATQALEQTPERTFELKPPLEALIQEKARATKPLNEKDLASLEKKILKTTKSLKKSEDKQLLYWKTKEISQLEKRIASLKKDIQDDHQKLTFGTNKLFRSQYHLQKNGFLDHQEWKEAWQHARSSNFSQLGSKDETAGNQVCQTEAQPDGTITLTITLPPVLVRKYQQETLVVPRIKFNYGHATILAALQSCQQRNLAKSQSWSLLHEDVKKFLRRPVASLDAWEKHERSLYQTAYQELFQDLGQALFYRFMEDKKGRWKLYTATGVAPGKSATSDELGVVGTDLNQDHFSLVDINHRGNYLSSWRVDYNFYGLDANQRGAEVERVAKEVVAWAKGKKKYLILEDLDFQELKAKIGQTSPARARALHALPYATLRTAIIRRAYKEGVEVRIINPAYGSIIGKFKFQKMYGLSSHASAALVNGRRYSKFSERAVPSKKYHLFLGSPTPKILSLPVWKTRDKLWKWWHSVRRKLIRAVAPHSWARMRPMIPVNLGHLGRNLQQKGKDSQELPDEMLVPSYSHRSDGPSVETLAAQGNFGLLGSLVGLYPPG